MNSGGDKQPFVSIITLNYNQVSVTAAFLESARTLLYTNFEILVCDMGSDTDPSETLSIANYPNTRLLRSPVNLGFSGGNNWGMSQATGEFLFIVNNDTELTPDIIGRLLAPFTADPAIAVVCPKIKYFFDRHTIQYAGFRPMTPFTARTYSIGENEPDNGQYDVSGITNGAHGCAMMVKREVITKTGMFPEKFFLYYEEWDWSARIKKAGFKIWYEASATIYHKESVSFGKNNPMKIYYLARNRILYMRRNSDFFHLSVFFAFFMFLTTPKAIFNYVRKGEWNQLKWFLKGTVYNLFHSSK